MVRSISLVLVLAFCAGCANWDSIYRTHTFDLDNPVAKSAFVDLKQREIIAGNYTVCPSPLGDVMAAYAAELAGKADIPDKVKTEIAAAAQSSAAYIGIRSRNIQFSRDQLYSLCIDRMNDTVDDAQYNFYKARLHRYAMAMAGVEQLTDPVVAPPVVLGSSGSSNIHGIAQEDQAKLDTLKKEKEDIEKSGGPMKDGQSLTTEEKAQVKELEKNILEIEDKVRNAVSLSVRGQSGGNVGNNATQQSGPTDKVVDAVKKIVISTLLTDDAPLMCVERLINIENSVAGKHVRVGDMSRYPRELNEAELAEVEYCRTVLSGAGNASPLMRLHPDLLKWVTQ
mgnify:CR=1 FL=1